MEALLHATLPVLCEHLTVADVFRLQLRDDDWADDVPALLASRMHLRPQFDMRALGHKMRRCVECGVHSAPTARCARVGINSSHERHSH